jgi:hypothetical protein
MHFNLFVRRGTRYQNDGRITSPSRSKVPVQEHPQLAPWDRYDSAPAISSSILTTIFDGAISLTATRAFDGDHKRGIFQLRCFDLGGFPFRPISAAWTDVLAVVLLVAAEFSHTLYLVCPVK